MLRIVLEDVDGNPVVWILDLNEGYNFIGAEQIPWTPRNLAVYAPQNGLEEDTSPFGVDEHLEGALEVIPQDPPQGAEVFAPELDMGLFPQENMENAEVRPQGYVGVNHQDVMGLDLQGCDGNNPQNIVEVTPQGHVEVNHQDMYHGTSLEDMMETILKTSWKIFLKATCRLY